jgi:nucleotide-binding universal stress UspA family protein
MKTLEVKEQIALKNILFATDFEAPARWALPFAVALSDRYSAKLYVAHVIPQEAYLYARPESLSQILKETQSYANYALKQLAITLTRHGGRCETLLGEGDVSSVLIGFIQQHAVDLAVVGASNRGGLEKLVLGSVAEEIIREAPCPVLTVGPNISADASAGIQCILCAIDFSPESLRAAKFALSLANRNRAHLNLLHVIERIDTSPESSTRLMEKRLREIIPPETELPFEAEVMIETGRADERILNVASDLLADIIVMGVRGVGAFAETASRLGSIVHKVVSLAKCPVLTVGVNNKM